MDNNEAKKTIEAALFMSPGSVNIRELAKSISSNIAETRVLANELIHDYEARNTSLEIRDDPDGLRMGVKEKYEDRVGHMAASPEMHKGIMKTLAYIAYKQPVKQSEVINFRNSKAYEHIKLLKEKGFLRKEKKGITYVITTTPKFKDYFGSNVKTEEKIEDSLEEKQGNLEEEKKNHLEEKTE